MSGVDPFTFGLLLTSAALVLAVGSNRLAARIRIPAPALFLLGAATASAVFPALGKLPLAVDEQIVTVALVFILFDGGMHIGWRRFRAAAGATAWVAIAGTAATAAALAAVAYLLLGLPLQTSLLLGAALSPTDPAVVFSVLGKRDIAGRSGTILEGESGLNDPVGIAVIVSILGATGAGWGAAMSGVGQFALQMVVGAAVGLAGGWVLGKLMRHSELPNEALYSQRAIAFAVLIYAAATVLHGSGFLAVFVAGILVGDAHAPFKQEVERFSSGVAGLAEIATFVVLGLSVSWSEVLRPAVLVPGLVLAALMILVIRPILVGVLMIPIRLAIGERVFILLAGLKGAVPILLGMFILQAGAPEASRAYGVIFIVVLASVLIQASVVPLLATKLRVPMRIVEPRPWAAGLRFPTEPSGLQRHVVNSGSAADGVAIARLGLGDSDWISMISRRGQPIPVRGDTRLLAGDEVLAFGESAGSLDHLFGETHVDGPVPKAAPGEQRDQKS